MKRRVLSGLLVIIMIFSLIPMNEVKAQETKEELTEENLQELADLQLSEVYAEALRQATEYQKTDEYKMLIEEALQQKEINKEDTQILNQTITTKEVVSIETSVEDNLTALDDYAIWKEEYVKELEAQADSISQKMVTLNSLNGNIMSNEYLGACVNSSGCITLGTTGGNPESSTDNNKKLLYGYPGSSTTYTTVRIDGYDQKFYPNGGIQFYPDGSKCIATMVVGDITIQQVVAFDMNYTTGREDMARIKYMITNNGTSSHTVGIRIMLDTMLGSNDGVPFRIPGIGNVTKEIELSGNSIPQYWQAFDSFDQPNVIANGCFYKSVSNKPDKVQYAYWGDINGVLWNYKVNTNQGLTGDSAVAMYYNPKTVAPGGQRVIETYYGIGDSYEGNEESELSLRVAAPKSLIANSLTGNYESNPFTVTVYIKNNGSTTAKNIKATISLPSTDELTMVGNASKTKSIGDLASGVEKTITFSVKAKSQNVQKVLEGNIALTSSNCESQSAVFQMTLPKVTVNKVGTISLNKDSVSLAIGKSETLIAKLNNLSGTVTWVSDNPTVATVSSNGIVTAKKAGTANIKASLGGKVATCKVIVSGSGIPAQVMYFSPQSVTIDVNEVKNLKGNLTFIPSNTTTTTIKSWKSSNSSIVRVTNGVITGLKEGTATVTAYLADRNLSATMTVTVAHGQPDLTLASNINFSITEAGPTIQFGGHKWNLFDLPIGLQFKLGNKVKLVYNDDNDKYIASFGDIDLPTKTNDTDKDGKLTAEAKKLRVDAYRTIKNLLNSVGKKTNSAFYNSYRSLIKKSGPMAITGDKSIFGYVEFTRTSNGGYALGAGEVCVLFTAGVDLKYNFPPAPVVYLRFSITGTLQAGLKVKMLEAGNLAKGVDVSGEISMAVKPLVGVGGNIGVAKVEGGLEGEIKGTINLRPWSSPAFSPTRDLKLTLKAKLYLSYKALFFINGKKTWPITDFTIYPKTNRAALQSEIVSIQSEDLEIISNDYANAPSYFNGNNIIAANALDGNTTSQEIKSNVFPYGEPQIAELGQGKYLLVWLDNVSQRSSNANATALYYSYYNGKNWSEPLVVDEDGTSDFAPQIISNNDVAYLAWQNSEVTYDEEVSLNEVTRTIGIKAAKFENETFITYLITQPDQLIDSAPILTTDGTSVTLVWSKNSENDVFGIEGENTIYKCSFLTSEWSKPEKVYAETGYMGTLSSVILNDTLYIAYIKDMNGVFSESKDDEIMLIVGDNDPVQITNDDKVITNPRLLVYDGNVELYWYEDGVIQYKPEVTKEKQEIIETSESVGMNFEVVTNAIDKAIIWEEADGFSTNLKVIYFDVNAQLWGDVNELTNQQDRIRETKALLTKEGSLATVFILADLIEENDEEMTPYGESSLVLLQQSPGYDLGIDGSILYDEDSIKDGGTIHLGMYVENRGQKTIDKFEVQMLRDGKVVQTEEVSTHLLAGKGDFYEIPYQLETPFEAHNLDICVLALDKVDIKIADNTASVTLGTARIVLDGLNITGSKNSRTVSVDVLNEGFIDSGALYLEMIQSDGENEEVKATTVIDSIGKQESTFVDFNLPITSEMFTNGDILDQMIYVRVYSDNTQEELDYSFTNLPNPYYGDYITVSDVSLVGNAMVLNVENNLPAELTGQLCIKHETEDETVVVYGQEITLSSFYGQSYEIDLSGIDMEGGTLSVYVVDDEGWGISNEVFVDGINTARARKPIATPGSGIYDTKQYVTLESVNEDAIIYYTTDGLDPVIAASGSSIYTEPILVEKNTTIKAITTCDDLLDSEVTVFEYVIQEGTKTCGVPIASVLPGTYNETQTVVLTATGSAIIYYTTDGSDPKVVSGSSIYADPIIVDHSMTIKAYASCEGMEDSEVAEFTYIIIEEPQFLAEFKNINQWNTGFQGEIVITNISDEVIRNWNLSFDTDFMINNIWNANIKEHMGQHYVIEYADWNQLIYPGASVSIGFTADYSDDVNAPINYILESAFSNQEDIDTYVTYALISGWNTAYQGGVTIQNNNMQQLVDWTLEFDFAGEISQIYTADIIEHVGNHYVIKGKDYNRNIAGNSSLNFQFIVSTPQIPLEFTNISIH